MRPVLRPSRVAIGFVWLSRIVSLACIAFGIAYWVRLIGLDPGALSRFDLMPVHWQVVSTVLAAFYPVAGVGLWMLAAWGSVIWLICAAIETVMFVMLPDMFGENWPLVAFHAAAALAFAVLRAALFFEKRRSRA